MTIEAQLERIAIALEALVESQGIVTEQQIPLPLKDVAAPADDLDDMDDPEPDDGLDDDDEPPAPAPKKKTAKKKKKKASSKQVGKPSEEVTSKYTADEVRSKLKDLQLTSGSAAEPKSILKAHGASTFGQLPIARYDQVIAEVDAKMDEYE